MDPHLHVGADAGGSSKRSLLRLPAVETEFPLPEVRKKYCDEVWKAVTIAGIDCIFDDELPPDEHYKTTPTPLETVPIPTVDASAGVTQKDVQVAMRMRAQLTAANTAKQELRDKLLRDIKASLGVAMLDALEAKAPLTWKRMKRNHVLIAASGARPAKYNGCAIFSAYTILVRCDRRVLAG